MLNEICSKSLQTIINSVFKGRGVRKSRIRKALTKKGLPVRIHAILINAGWLQRSCFIREVDNSVTQL